VTGTPCTQLKSLGDSRENVFDMYGDSCANLLEFLAVGARGKRRVFSPGAAHTESPQKTIFFTFLVEAQVPKQVAKPKKMCLGARRLTQLPRATQSSKFPSEDFCTVLCLLGFRGAFRSSFPGPCYVLDPAPFHPNKHVFLKNRRINSFINSSIHRAGCRRGILGVVCTVPSATKRVEEAAKTTFQKKNENRKKTEILVVKISIRKKNKSDLLRPWTHEDTYLYTYR